MSDQQPETDPAVAALLEQERKERIIRHQAESFLELEKHPAWQVLLDYMETKRSRQRTELAALFLDGGVELDQREIDRARGFAEGTRYLEATVAAAQNTLDRLDRLAERRADSQTTTEPDIEGGLEAWT